MDKMARLQALEAELARRKAQKVNSAILANRARAGDMNYVSMHQQKEMMDAEAKRQAKLQDYKERQLKLLEDKERREEARAFLDQAESDYGDLIDAINASKNANEKRRLKRKAALLKKKAENVSDEFGIIAPSGFLYGDDDDANETAETTGNGEQTSTDVLNDLLRKAEAGTLTDADLKSAKQAVISQYGESEELGGMLKGIDELGTNTVEAKQKQSQAKAKAKQIKELSDQLDLAEKRGDYREAVRIKKEIKLLGGN